MTELFATAAISIFLFFCFLFLVVLGFIRKSRKIFVMSALAFLLMIGSVGSLAYLTVTKSYNRITAFLKPRTGEEIYIALFDSMNSRCTEVLHHADQVIPKLDDGIRLHFRTCPEELRRILELHEFQHEKKSSSDLEREYDHSNYEWFKPETLGDSILVFFSEIKRYKNWQTIYSSQDSTEVFCIDILD